MRLLQASTVSGSHAIGVPMFVYGETRFVRLCNVVNEGSRKYLAVLTFAAMKLDDLER